MRHGTANASEQSDFPSARRLEHIGLLMLLAAVFGRHKMQLVISQPVIAVLWFKLPSNCFIFFFLFETIGHLVPGKTCPSVTKLNTKQ